MSKMLSVAPKWPASGRIEEIHWRDHVHGSGWSKPPNYDTDPLAICRSVGYLLNEDADVVRLIQSHDGTHGNIDSCQVIGKVLIVSRRVLRRR